jgi:predicted methyltransferase
MEARITKLEEFAAETKDRLVRIETRLDGINATMATMATKADLADLSERMIKWIAGTAIAMSAAAITVMTFVLNHATPKAPVVQPAPIIITIPAATLLSAPPKPAP